MPESTSNISEDGKLEIEILQGKVAEQDVLLKEQANLIAEQKTLIDGQAAEIISLKTSAGNSVEPVKPEIEVDGKRWKFKFASFVFEGNRIVAEDAALDAELIEKILNTENQGILIQLF